MGDLVGSSVDLGSVRLATHQSGTIDMKNARLVKLAGKLPGQPISFTDLLNRAFPNTWLDFKSTIPFSTTTGATTEFHNVTFETFGDGRCVHGNGNLGSYAKVTNHGIAGNSFTFAFSMKANGPGAWRNPIAFWTGNDNTTSRIEKGAGNNYIWYISGIFTNNAHIFDHDGSTWDRIVLWCDGTTAKCFKNGVQTHTQSVAGSIPANSALMICCRNGTNAGFWRGRIGDVKCFSYPVNLSLISRI